MAEVDPKFFEKISAIYAVAKSLTVREKIAVVEFAKYIDNTLNEKQDKGGEQKKL